MPVAEIMHEDEQTEIDVLYFAINQLPPERRRIFMMVYAEGKKYKEVAEHLQISIKVSSINSIYPLVSDSRTL